MLLHATIGFITFACRVGAAFVSSGADSKEYTVASKRKKKRLRLAALRAAAENASGLVVPAEPRLSKREKRRRLYVLQAINTRQRFIRRLTDILGPEDVAG